MHSLVNEIAAKLNVTPAEAELAVTSMLIRIRAALETVGEAEIAGLGKFKSLEGHITFEPAADFETEINKEFSGMKPVALTATGESVDVDDRRALPGVSDTVAPSVETESVQPTVEEPEAETEVVDSIAEASVADQDAQIDGAQEEVDEMSGLAEEVVDEAPDVFQPPRELTFTSPPPPKPSKIRVPPKSRRSSEYHRGEHAEDFPDMESVVSSRPVQSIHSGKTKRGLKTTIPVAVLIAVIAGGAWMILGGSGEDEAEPEATPQMVESASEEMPAPAASSSEGGENVQPEEVAPPIEETAMDAEAEDATAVPASDEASPETEVVAEAQTEDELEIEAEAEPAVPVESQTEASPAASSAPVFAWIVASYPSREEAQVRAIALQDQGFDANVYQATVQGRPAYRVGVGRFESQSAAWQSHAIVPPEASDAWITRVQ